MISLPVLFLVLLVAGIYIEKLTAYAALLWLAAMMVLCAVLKTVGADIYTWIGLVGILTIALAIVVIDHHLITGRGTPKH